MTIYDPKVMTLQQAINKAASGDCVLDGVGQTVWLQEATRISIPDGVYLVNFVFKYGALVDFAMLGNHPRLYNCHFNTYGFQSNTPIIELVETTNPEIVNCSVTGDNIRKAIMCKTEVHNLLIDTVRVYGNIGWGILLNDSEKEQGVGFRKFDGKDYNDRPVATNVTIRNFQFGEGLVNPARTGDGVEINGPDYGIDGLILENIIVHNTFATSSSGISIGAARTSNTRMTNITVKNGAKFGIHLEKGENHVIENFRTENCARALSIGHTKNTTFRNGECVNSGEMFTAYNRLDQVTTGYGPSEKVTLENIKFKGCTVHGILAANADGYVFKNLEMSGYNADPAGSFIRLYQQDTEKVRQGVTRTVLDGIAFNQGDGKVTPEFLINVDNSSENVIGAISSKDFVKKMKVNGNTIYA